MGNEQSQLNGGGGAGRGELPWGFQVLRNTNEHLAIEPWFDFIVGINGRQIVSSLMFDGGAGGGGWRSEIRDEGCGDRRLM